MLNENYSLWKFIFHREFLCDKITTEEMMKWDSIMFYWKSSV